MAAPISVVSRPEALKAQGEQQEPKAPEAQMALDAVGSPRVGENGAGGAVLVPDIDGGRSRHLGQVSARLQEARRAMRSQAELGLATAEYAIATIAAAGFAGVLIVILKSGKVQTLLGNIIESALSVG